MRPRLRLPIRSLIDVAKVLFVISLLLAFGMRRALEENHGRLPWLSGILFGTIVLTGTFLLVTWIWSRFTRRPSDDES